jgi:hypothetical protein
MELGGPEDKPEMLGLHCPTSGSTQLAAGHPRPLCLSKLHSDQPEKYLKEQLTTWSYAHLQISFIVLLEQIVRSYQIPNKQHTKVVANPVCTVG